MKNVFRVLSIIALVVVIGLSMSACSGGSDDKDNTTTGGGTGGGGTGGNDGIGKKGNLSKMNIVGATNLFIAPVSANRSVRAASDTSVNKLFKITEDGHVQEVTYTYEDEDGNPVTSSETLSPTSIIVLNTEYLIICFENNNYLVNSNTGACYLYTNDLPNPDQNKDVRQGEYIGNDENGNIYFIANGAVRKITISDIDNITISTLSAPNDKVTSFGLDKYGNIAYEAKDGAGNGVLRYRKIKGGYETLPGTPYEQSLTTFWQGFYGELFFYNLSYYTSNLNNNSATSSAIGKIQAEPYAIISSGSGMLPMYEGRKAFKNILKIKNKNAIIGIVENRAISYLYTDQLDLIRIDGVDQRIIPKFPAEVDIFRINLTSLKFGFASDNFYYIVGVSADSKSVLLKIDPVDYIEKDYYWTYNVNYTKLINGEFDVFKATVSTDDVITFNALRMSDGAIVMGEISATGVVTILDATLTNEVIFLEKLR